MAGFPNFLNFRYWKKVIMGGNTNGESNGRYTPTEKENEKKYGGLISLVVYKV